MPFPYVPSGGVIQQAIEQFKKALPPKVDAATLKKLGVAPSNEGYVINVLRFLGLTDDKNDRTQAGIDLFSTHGDEAFKKAFTAIIEISYSALFELQGKGSWSLDRDALIAFFRGSDKTSSIVGTRQAVTFAALATMAGQRDASSKPAPSNGPRPRPTQQRSSPAKKLAPQGSPADPPKPDDLQSANSAVALTVRIEINLPANGSQTTYDNILKSIKANLLVRNV